MSNDASGPAKKKHRPHVEDHPPHAEHGGEEGWLVSYADMMTLLVGFFVILLSFANVDQEKFEEVKKSAAKEFGGKYESPTEDMAKSIREKLDALGAGTQIEVKNTEAGVEISFVGTVFFVPGSADVKGEGQKILEGLMPTIKEKSADYKITVEGHTDDIPLSARAEYRNNFELSSIRACRVVDYFIAQGFDKSILTAIGYGDGRPLVPNRDDSGASIPENQAKNRRVVIKLTKNGGSAL